MEDGMDIDNDFRFVAFQPTLLSQSLNGMVSYRRIGLAPYRDLEIFLSSRASRHSCAVDHTLAREAGSILSPTHRTYTEIGL